jgi:hypothetical protein
MTREKVLSEPLLRLPGGELWNFPYSARKQKLIQGLVRLRHGGSVWETLQGLKELLGC